MASFPPGLPPQPPPPKRPSFAAPLKLLAASVGGMLLALGLCGVAVATNQTRVLVPIMLGLAGLSVVGFVVSILWCIVLAFERSSH